MRELNGRLVSFVLLLGLVAGGCSSDSQTDPTNSTGSYQGQTLTIASFGGAVKEQMNGLAGEVFESLTGARIEWVQGTSRTHMKALRAAKGKTPPFDVVMLDGIIQQMAGAEGLLETLTEDEVPQMKNLIPQAKTQNGGPAFQFFSVGIAYNHDALSEAGLHEPATWRDFWRPELKGHVAVPSILHAAGIDFVIAAAIVEGKDPETLEGLKAGIDAIARLEPAHVFGRSTLDCPTLQQPRLLSHRHWRNNALCHASRERLWPPEHNQRRPRHEQTETRRFIHQHRAQPRVSNRTGSADPLWASSRESHSFPSPLFHRCRASSLGFRWARGAQSSPLGNNQPPTSRTRTPLVFQIQN